MREVGASDRSLVLRRIPRSTSAALQPWGASVQESAEGKDGLYRAPCGTDSRPASCGVVRMGLIEPDPWRVASRAKQVDPLGDVATPRASFRVGDGGHCVGCGMMPGAHRGVRQWCP